MAWLTHNNCEGTGILPSAAIIAKLAFVGMTGAGAQQESETPPQPPPIPTPGPATANANVTESPIKAAAEKVTKQIQVICDEPETRLAFITFSDTIERSLRNLLDDRTGWVFPIKITVKGSLSDFDGPPAAVLNRIDVLPNGQFSLQLGIRLSRDFQREEAVRELLRLLLFERMLRPYQTNPNGIAGKTIETPPWLLDGTDQLIRHHESGRPSDFYAGILQSRQVLSIRQILNGDPAAMDPLSGAVYRASSAALVGALLDQPQGRHHFQEFLGGLAGAEPEAVEPMIRQHFPGLRGSAGALEKWWSLQVAHMGMKQVFEFLTVAETEARLDEALGVHFGVEPQEDPKGLVGKFLPRLKPGQPFDGRIHDFEKFLGRRDAGQVLERSRLRLRQLSTRCFPLYRNVVARYEAAVLLLIQKRKRGVRAELEAIDKARAGVSQTMERATDFMNHYEATQAEGKSRAFQNYRAARRKIEQRRRPHRKDRLSRYLDALEPEFEKPTGP